MLPPVNQPLDAIAFSIGIVVESRVGPFVALGRDHRRDAPPSQGGADDAAAVSLVGGQPVGLEARSPAAQPPDPAGAHHYGERLAVGTWPPVKVNVTGKPWPSARTWILVEMSAEHGAVHVVQAPVHPTLAVGTGLQGLQDALQDAGAAPAVEPV